MSQTRPCSHYAYKQHLFLKLIYMFFNYVWMNPVLSRKHGAALLIAFIPEHCSSSLAVPQFGRLTCWCCCCFISRGMWLVLLSDCNFCHRLIECIDLCINRDEGELNYDLLSLKLPLWFLVVGIKGSWRVIALGGWWGGGGFCEEVKGDFE